MSLSVSLKHRLGAFTLDAQFDAPQGLTVLYGPSGSGKTTIINAVAGLLRPDHAKITVDGVTLADTGTDSTAQPEIGARRTARRGIWLPPHRRRIGYVFQDARLFPHLSVRGNLRYGAWFAPKTAIKPNMDEITEMLGIGHLLGRRPAGLSGGERQRVAIGRALLAAPQMILADEPLAALDQARKDEILPYFERLRDALTLPILYVSHAPSEVARLATTVVALDAGKVLRAGPAAQVLGDPEVTPMGPRAAGAMIETRVIAHHADGLTELAMGDLRLLIPRAGGRVGTPLRVHIEAQDVMIATRRPDGISALNVLPATVREIRIGQGPGALVQLDADGHIILARVTRRSVKNLGLCAGQKVFAILKAVSVAKASITG